MASGKPALALVMHFGGKGSHKEPAPKAHDEDEDDYSVNDEEKPKESDDDSEDSELDACLDEAYDAAEAKDRDKFREAMKAALSCK